jgi:hypothetical protein
MLTKTLWLNPGVWSGQASGAKIGLSPVAAGVGVGFGF